MSYPGVGQIPTKVGDWTRDWEDFYTRQGVYELIFLELSEGFFSIPPLRISGHGPYLSNKER